MNSNWAYILTKWAWLDPLPSMPSQTGASSAAFDRYAREARVAVALVFIGFLGQGFGAESPGMFGATLSSAGVGLWVLGIAGGVAAYGRYVRHWDELQQRIGSTASAIALAATGLLLFTNMVAAQRHLVHANPTVVAIVPLASYWIAVIAVRAQFASSESSEAS